MNCKQKKNNESLKNQFSMFCSKYLVWRHYRHLTFYTLNSPLVTHPILDTSFENRANLRVINCQFQFCKITSVHSCVALHKNSSSTSHDQQNLLLFELFDFYGTFEFCRAIKTLIHSAQKVCVCVCMCVF